MRKTTFTCDGCDATETTDGKTLPEGWFVYTIQATRQTDELDFLTGNAFNQAPSPPQMPVRHDLCADCISSIPTRINPMHWPRAKQPPGIAISENEARLFIEYSMFSGRPSFVRPGDKIRYTQADHGFDGMREDRADFIDWNLVTRFRMPFNCQWNYWLTDSASIHKWRGNDALFAVVYASNPGSEVLRCSGDRVDLSRDFIYMQWNVYQALFSQND